MAAIARRSQRSTNIWPGFVDALATLLMVLIFLIMIFVLYQFSLKETITGRDATIERLQSQVSELADLLSLERRETTDLRLDVAQLFEELQASVGLRDDLEAAREALTIRAEVAEKAAADAAARAARLDAALESATKTIAADKETIRVQLGKLADLDQQIAALQALRDDLEREVADLDGKLRTSEAAAADLSASLEASRARIVVLSGRLEESEVRAADLSGSLEASQARIVVLSGKLEDSEARGADLSAKLEISQARIVVLSGNLEDSETRAASLSGSLEDSQARIVVVSRKLEDSEARGADLSAKLEDSQARIVVLSGRLAASKAEVAAMSGRLARSRAAIAEERNISESARAQLALLNRQMAALRRQLKELSAILDASEKLAEAQKVQIQTLGQRLNAALASKVQELSRYRSEFFGRLRELLGNRPGIRIVGDRFVFQSEVLFASGSADLAPEGDVQLAQLATTLSDIATDIPPEINWILRVDGHTDKIPINNALFPSNWELSTARAISVVKFLIGQGIPADRLAAMGFGEHQPLDSSDDARGLRRNRRIELKLTQR